MKTRILIIDEDPSALESYKTSLAPKASQWALDCFASADEAIESASQQKPNVVIVAHSTNAGEGAQVLAQFEKTAPDAQLFITAPEKDKAKLESTFGSSFQYLPSPCPATRLITEIQRSIAIDTWLGNERIKEIVAKMGEFPSLPAIYIKVVNALNSREASSETIAEAIAGDLAISAKVLQTVNSSYYGYDEKISSITQAVSILGTDCVKNLVLAIQVFNKMGSSAEHRAITDQLWQHSMSVAVAARRIALHETSDNKAAEEAYSAGLMHDIGKLVLLKAAPELFAQARALASEKTLPLREAEEEVIGCNHAETGAYILARWGMPANLTEAVALHHEPVNSFGKTFSALAAVHIANAIVHHRQRPEHPSSVPCQAFLTEIGKPDSWETWLAVSSGKKPSAAKLALATKGAPSGSSEANAAPAESDASTSSTEAAASESPRREPSSTAQATSYSPRPISEPEPKKRRGLLLALASCITVTTASTIYLYTLEDETADPHALSEAPFPFEDGYQVIEPAQDEADAKAAALASKSPLSSTIQKARDLSGLTQTEEALGEIFASQDPEPAPEAKHDSEAAAPQVAQASEPEPEQPASSEESFPKPKLAEPVEDAFPAIELAGIFYNADRPLASINGRIRKVGDTVSGAKIIRIDQNAVVVQYEKTIKSIKLN